MKFNSKNTEKTDVFGYIYWYKLWTTWSKFINFTLKATLIFGKSPAVIFGSDSVLMGFCAIIFDICVDIPVPVPIHNISLCTLRTVFFFLFSILNSALILPCNFCRRATVRSIYINIYLYVYVYIYVFLEIRL